MKKRTVISLGGSLIVSEDPSNNYLIELKTMLARHYKTHQFIIVCGGGRIAREYIETLRKQGKNEKELSLAGIRATRMNAQFVMQVFGKEANSKLPLAMKDVANALRKNSVAISGSLRYAKKETSDGSAAKLASYLHAPFINITNVSGLYTADPKKDRKAMFIPYDSWSSFKKRAAKLHYKAGQHFVLDQTAAALIKEKRIPTYIVGNSIANLERLILGRPFTGTTIGP